MEVLGENLDNRFHSVEKCRMLGCGNGYQRYQKIWYCAKSRIYMWNGVNKGQISGKNWFHPEHILNTYSYEYKLGHLALHLE